MLCAPPSAAPGRGPWRSRPRPASPWLLLPAPAWPSSPAPRAPGGRGGAWRRSLGAASCQLCVRPRLWSLRRRRAPESRDAVSKRGARSWRPPPAALGVRAGLALPPRRRRGPERSERTLHRNRGGFLRGAAALSGRRGPSVLVVQRPARPGALPGDRVGRGQLQRQEEGPPSPSGAAVGRTGAERMRGCPGPLGAALLCRPASYIWK